MGKLSAIVVADSERAAESLRSQLESSGGVRVHTVAPERLSGDLPAYPPDVVFAALDQDPDSVISALERLPEPRPALVVAGPEDDTRLLLRIVRLGVREFVGPKPDTETIQRVVRQLRERGAATAEKQAAGKLVTVLGCKGGVGATTVSCQLAGVLQQSHPTSLVDLNLASGDVALHHDVSPNYTLADLSIEMTELDETYLSTLLHPHKSGLSLLLAPNQPGGATLDGRCLARAIELLREEFQWVVADCARSWDEQTLGVLERSDVVLLVSGYDLPALHHTRRQIEILQQLGLDRKTRLVGNRCTAAGALPGGDVEKFLHRPLDIELANDFATTMKSIELGKHVAAFAANRRLGRDLEKLAGLVHEWCGVERQTGAQDRGLGRMFRWRRNAVA